MEPTMLSMMTNSIKMQAAEPKSKLYETVEQEPLMNKPSEQKLNDLLPCLPSPRIRDTRPESSKLTSTVSPSPIPLTA
jgi:hypothetical protein